MEEEKNIPKKKVLKASTKNKIAYIGAFVVTLIIIVGVILIKTRFDVGQKEKSNNLESIKSLTDSIVSSFEKSF